MRLYYATGTCSLAPDIALHTLEIPFEGVSVNIKTHQLADGTDFYAINPKGYVPVLELDDGRRLSEVPAILQYLADLRPALGLAPANGTFERYRLQEWLGFISSELHKAFSPLFKPDLDPAIRQFSLDKIALRLGWLGKTLKADQYLMGNTFTIADAYLFTILTWGKFTGVDIAQWPVLKAYFERILALPATQAAMKAEGLIREKKAATK